MAKITKSKSTKKIGSEAEEDAPSPPLEELCFINPESGVQQYAEGCACSLFYSSGGGQYSEAYRIVLCPKHRAKKSKNRPK